MKEHSKNSWGFTLLFLIWANFGLIWFFTIENGLQEILYGIRKEIIKKYSKSYPDYGVNVNIFKDICLFIY